jgi:hypothetical protein
MVAVGVRLLIDASELLDLKVVDPTAQHEGV